jgi:membrane-associated phospholipid phosphatase
MLTVLVATRATGSLDLWTTAFFRPHDHWGDLQIRVDAIVEGLKPANCAALVALLMAVISVRRRSWRPVVCTGLVGVVGAGLTLGVKVIVRRLDTHDQIGGIGGSYPSGHVVGVLVVAGCMALVLRRRPGWLGWAPVALVSMLMAWALLVQTAHWLTDVGGSVLLGVGVLTAATWLPFHHTGTPGEPQARRDAPRTRSKTVSDSFLD